MSAWIGYDDVAREIWAYLHPKAPGANRGEGTCCESPQLGDWPFICTRPEGHVGKHVAHGNAGYAVAVWDQEESR